MIRNLIKQSIAIVFEMNLKCNLRARMFGRPHGGDYSTYREPVGKRFKTSQIGHSQKILTLIKFSGIKDEVEKKFVVLCFISWQIGLKMRSILCMNFIYIQHDVLSAT
jgi:hypothetical protein